MLRWCSVSYIELCRVALCLALIHPACSSGPETSGFQWLPVAGWSNVGSVWAGGLVALRCLAGGPLRGLEAVLRARCWSSVTAGQQEAASAPLGPDSAAQGAYEQGGVANRPCVIRPLPANGGQFISLLAGTTTLAFVPLTRALLSYCSHACRIP